MLLLLRCLNLVIPFLYIYFLQLNSYKMLAFYVANCCVTLIVYSCLFRYLSRNYLSGLPLTWVSMNLIGLYLPRHQYHSIVFLFLYKVHMIKYIGDQLCSSFIRNLLFGPFPKALMSITTRTNLYVESLQIYTMSFVFG